MQAFPSDATILRDTEPIFCIRFYGRPRIIRLPQPAAYVFNGYTPPYLPLIAWGFSIF